MKQELLDKEVLCIYDIRAIQSYIFSKNNNIDILGAGEFVKDIHREAFVYVFKHLSSKLSENEYSLDEWENPTYVPYFYDSSIKAQLVTIGGGNAFMLFRTGALADEVNKIYARYILQASYSLQVAVAATERTDNFSQDINYLYDELARVKNAQPLFHPLGTLPIVEKEAGTGNPVYGIDERTGEHISWETWGKRERARRGLGEEMLSNMSEIAKYHRMLAYIHIDGNGFGLIIGRIFSKIKDYEDGIVARRKLNANITLNYLSSLDEAEDQLKAIMYRDGITEGRYYQFYQRLNVGGDDINVVCAGKYAFAFVSIFVDIVTKKYIWNDDLVGAIKFSVCAGIAFVHSNIDYFLGYKFAEQCCGEAKKEARKSINNIDGEIGNWVDYQIINDIRQENIDTIRERDYSSEGYNLCLRPYCFDKVREGTVTHINHLQKLYDAFDKYLPMTLKCRLLDAISESPSKAHIVLDSFMQEMREDARKLLENKLLPVVGDDLVNVEGKPAACAHWYDALELSSMSELEKLRG